jgi:hypothetical protein
MHFSFNLLRIKGLYMFRALLAHPQEALHKRHLVYCVRIMSVGCGTVCGTVAVSLQPCHWFSINWMISASRWLHYTDILWCTVSKTYFCHIHTAVDHITIYIHMWFRRYIIYTDSILFSLYSWHSILHPNLHFIRSHHSWLTRYPLSIVATTLVDLLLGMHSLFCFLIAPITYKLIQSLVEKHIKFWSWNISTVFPKSQFLWYMYFKKTSSLDIIFQFWFPFQDHPF